MTINAFSPAYVKTYMPEFLSTIRKEEKQKADGEKSGAKARASLKPTEFFYYSKAGMPKDIK